MNKWIEKCFMSCYFPLNDFSIFTCRLKRTFSWHAKEWTWWMLSNKYKNIWYIFCLTRNLLTLDLNCINSWHDSNRVKNLLFLHFNCFLFFFVECDTNMNWHIFAKKISFKISSAHKTCSFTYHLRPFLILPLSKITSFSQCDVYYRFDRVCFLSYVSNIIIYLSQKIEKKFMIRNIAFSFKFMVWLIIVFHCLYLHDNRVFMEFQEHYWTSFVDFAIQHFYSFITLEVCIYR